MENNKQLNVAFADKKNPSFIHAVTCFMGVFLMISLGLFVFEASLHAIIFLALVWTAMQAAWLGHSFLAIRQMMNHGIYKALPALYIFMLIGMVIASYMQSGTIASLLFYGLDFLNPVIFLPVGLILCCLMSVATGTSWGTVGTLGVVLMGIGDAMGIPLPVVAGMIISGATFGDKLSPISDTTNLAAMSAETSLYRHIYSMLFTTVPTFLIVLCLFVLIGLKYADAQLYDATTETTNNSVRLALNNAYLLNPTITLLPLLVMFAMSIKRYAPEVSMSISIFIAMLIAIVYQGKSGIDVLNALWLNSEGSTGIKNLDELLGRGGIYSMAWTLLLSIMALALGGILHHAGFLRVMLINIIMFIRRIGTLIATTIAAGFVCNLALGEAYISIILNSQLFKGFYEEKDIDKAILSRSVEEGATLTAALVPWTTTGTFYAATLGVTTLEYVPYALLNLLNPCFAIIMAYLGIGLLKNMRKIV
ncbi:transporter, NhaC family [Nitrosomonas marina]|uniref:Transporter, NhaC family n=1 Tax=Nitrosomonas marina TaxID=917 RepID=A0A1H9ZFR5_9PROT|nr:Na+/H+ antiporter NhaC [Nitrosomonas marina]SES80507.1 transporter, NhaC family [Nitrosomonas marina]